MHFNWFNEFICVLFACNINSLITILSKIFLILNDDDEDVNDEVLLMISNESSTKFELTIHCVLGGGFPVKN